MTPHKKNISVIFGTRPEAIKLAPLIRALKESHTFMVNVCITAQHRSMLDQMLEFFDISADIDLNLMTTNQSLPEMTAKAISKVFEYLENHRPDAVLVQGDTTTTFVSSLAAFYNKIPVGHVEAGLRSDDKYSPFPEEMNRVLTTRLCDWHFVPTLKAKEALIRENVPVENIFETGNTVIDSLKLIRKRINSRPLFFPRSLREIFSGGSAIDVVLITGHRRENFGDGLRSICRALTLLADKFPETVFIYPVHLNPNVREPVFKYLEKKENIYLVDPLPYPQFVALMEKSILVLTDSGGIQEECGYLGKPVLVMREKTERPEGIESGVAQLVGTKCEKITKAAEKLLLCKNERNKMAINCELYGDGNASSRIVKILKKRLNQPSS